MKPGKRAFEVRAINATPAQALTEIHDFGRVAVALCFPRPIRSRPDSGARFPVVPMAVA